MASGSSHDRAALMLALPFGLLCWPALGPMAALIGGLAFLLGGLWLSPDLDTHSNATRRWGPLRVLWRPYRRLLVHRSLFSHGPLLGSAGRLLYLAALVMGMGLLARPLGGPAIGELAGPLLRLWQTHRPLLLTALAGLEASAWLHLIQDGDPLPPAPWRRRRRAPRR